MDKRENFGLPFEQVKSEQNLSIEQAKWEIDSLMDEVYEEARRQGISMSFLDVALWHLDHKDIDHAVAFLAEFDDDLRKQVEEADAQKAVLLIKIADQVLEIKKLLI